jgi:hypothetical protein
VRSALFQRGQSARSVESAMSSICKGLAGRPAWAAVKIGAGDPS